MKSLGTRGMDELHALKRRVVRSYAMGRIGKADHDFIVKRLDEIEARIVQMPEYGEEEE